LRVGNGPSTICASTARKEDYLIAGGSSRIEVETSVGLEVGDSIRQCNAWANEAIYQTAYDESESGLVVMLPCCDEIPFLASTPIAGFDLDWGQILSKIP
jgi:hypothetical protein